MPNQSNMNMQGPPRGPPPAQQMGPGPNNMGNVQQMPAPHVNPAFFNQNSGNYLQVDVKNFALNSCKLRKKNLLKWDSILW